MGGMGMVLAEALLPVLLLRLAAPATATAAATRCCAEERVLLVKALLLLFALAHADKRASLLELLLPPLCAALCIGGQGQGGQGQGGMEEKEGEFPNACGRGLTHIARQAPEAFRSVVPLLSDVHRAVLQRVMTAAVQAAAQTQASQAGVGGVGGNGFGGGAGGGGGMGTGGGVGGGEGRPKPIAAKSTSGGTSGSLDMSKWRK
jgi:hypothetical protein